MPEFLRNLFNCPVLKPVLATAMEPEAAPILPPLPEPIPPPSRSELEAQLERILLTFNDNPFGRGIVTLSQSGNVISGGPVGFFGNISDLPNRDLGKRDIISQFNKQFGTNFVPNFRGVLSVDVV